MAGKSKTKIVYRNKPTSRKRQLAGKIGASARRTKNYVTRFVDGNLESMGLNYVFESLKLPGYGVGIIPGLGVDDVLQTALGCVYAYLKGGGSPKYAEMVGMVSGLGITKAFEQKGGRIQHISGLPW